mmetsp:Transcript_104637/g.293242  ORF Transcript_104637/g.293242 Transcript_104637/m.293242 type:complete len:275 (+) Transcript_104637:1065-1889(+)
MNGSTTADNTGQTIDRHGDVGQQNTGMDSPVVDSLLCLLDEGFAERLPSQVFGDTVDLFEGLVNGDRSNRNRRVSHNPLASFVNVLTSGQVHESVGTPKSTPLELLHFLFNRRGDGRVADVGVDLDLEHPPDDLRLKLLVILVGANNSTPTSDFGTDEFGFDTFSLRDKQHFLSDDTLLGKVHLSVTLKFTFTVFDPLLSKFGESLLGVETLRSGRVIEIKVRLVRVFQVDATEWDVEDVTVFMSDRLVLLGRVWESLIIWHRFDAFKLWVQRV